MEQREEEKKYYEETLNVSTEGLSKLKLSSEPFGKARDDRGVVITNGDGFSKKISSIMMGYNKDKIELENGDYVSWEEFEQALTIELSKNEENVTIISKKTGKQVSTTEMVEEIFNDVVSKSSYITHEFTDKISNQSATAVSIHSGEKEYKKGVAMFGKDDIKLPNGEFLSEQEILIAMEDYVKRVPIVDDDNIEENNKEETHKVINRTKNKHLWLFPLVTATAIILSMFGKQNVTEQQILTHIENDLRYQTTVEEVVDVYETQPEIQKRIYSGIITGQQKNIPHGIQYHESSDYEYGGANKKGTIGVTQNRPEGNYRIDYFSILDDGKIAQVELKEGVDLYTTLEEACQKTGKSIEELEAKLHIGGPVSGWIDVNDIILNEEFDAKLVESKIVLDQEQSYSGTIDNFKGDFITINDGEKDVNINIKDEQGNLLEEGATVIGSDGQSYQFSTLEIDEEEIIDVQEITTGTKTTWKLENITQKEKIVIAAIGLTELAISLASLKKKKEYVDMTDSQIDSLIQNEYEQCKRKFGGTSEFGRAVEKITKSSYVNNPQQKLRDDLIGQHISVEQIESISEGGKKR